MNLRMSIVSATISANDKGSFLSRAEYIQQKNLSKQKIRKLFYRRLITNTKMYRIVREYDNILIISGKKRLIEQLSINRRVTLTVKLTF